MSATVGAGTQPAEHAAKPRGLGWYGMVFFLASEAFFFANLIASYLYLHVRDGRFPEAAKLNVVLAGINTIILLSSSFPMHWAARGIAQGNQRRLSIGLILTAILGAILVTGQVVEYILLINDGVNPGSAI